MIVFCSACTKDVEVRIEERQEVLPVRGEDVEVDASVAVCTECGEDVWVDELEDATLARAFDAYRARHHLLLPTEMRRIRQQWGLGQRAFSQLLGWGEISLHRYEKGSLQDSAHDAQLRMAEHPENVRILLESNGDRLTPKQRQVVESRLREMEDAHEHEAGCDEDFERLLADTAKESCPNVPLSLTKVREVVAFFAELPDMYVSKLAKLMFYADFLHYCRFTTSITGLAYAHAPNGPIPHRYERIRDDLIENGLVNVEERCGATWSGEILVSQRPPDCSVFAQSELQVLQTVLLSLSKLSSKRLSEMSHAETAWLRTGMGQLIPYETAGDLSICSRLDAGK
jgi:putative zinc finger/helix-turn-helix YgiT family protein